MKKEKIICKLKESYKYKKKYWAISGIVVFSAVFCITVMKPNFIKDSKLYIQSLIEGDPNYEKLKEKVSLYVYKKEISLKEFEEGTVVKKEDEVKGPITATAIKSGFDSFTPSEIPKDDISTESSTYNSNNISSNSGNSNNYNVEEKPSSNNSNNTSSSNDSGKNENIEDKKEEFIDKSSFIGKDLLIYEGDKFDPLKNLKLSATDIDGSNITNKIVITENNVDTYKPGLYTVKANVQLSNNSKLEKDFLVRVETTALELEVVSLETELDIVNKKDEVTLDFYVKSSKDYIYVEKVVVNGKEYDARRKLSKNLFNKNDKYSTVVQAPEIAGINNLTMETIIMSDGTEVEIEKSISIEVLPEEAIVDDLVVGGSIDKDNINIDAEFTIKDIDNTLDSGKAILYDENNEIVREDFVKTNELIKLKYELLEEKVYTLKVFRYSKARPKEAELVNEVIDLRNAKALFVNNYNLISMMNEEGEDNSSSNEDTNTKNEKDIITSQSTSNSTISTEGRIKSTAGEVSSNIINISVPVNAAFTVDSNGNFIGSAIRISNNSKIAIDLFVENFIDHNDEEGIKIITSDDVRKNNLSVKNIENITYKRNEINLYLQGNNKRVYLGNKQVFSELGTIAYLEEQKNVATVLSNETINLVLDGVAGENPLIRDKAIQDKFTLILKMKKAIRN